MMRHKMQPKFWVCNIGGEVGMTAEILNSGFARMHLRGGECAMNHIGVIALLSDKVVDVQKRSKVERRLLVVASKCEIA